MMIKGTTKEGKTMPRENNPHTCFNDSCMCGAEDCPFCHPENVDSMERDEDIQEEEEESFHD